MLLGIAACFFLVIRVILALAGCPHNRWRALLFSPGETFRYGVGIVTGQARRYFVHNPGTSAVALAMFAIVPLLFFTGVNSGGGDFEEFHEILAYALLALIVAHLVGLAIHTFRYRENISLSMVSGAKPAPLEVALPSAHPIWGLALLIISIAWLGGLFASYNGANGTVTLPLIGTTIRLGENEGENEEESKRGNPEERGAGRSERSKNDDD